MESEGVFHFLSTQRAVFPLLTEQYLPKALKLCKSFKGSRISDRFAETIQAKISIIHRFNHTLPDKSEVCLPLEIALMGT